MSNELTMTTGVHLAPSAINNYSRSGEVIQAKDLDIPSVYVVQSNSSAALERDIQPGSLAAAGSSRVFAKPKQSWEFVPIGFRRVWDIYKKTGFDKLEWLQSEPYTPDNCNNPWEWSYEGVEFVRKQKLHVICLDKTSLKNESEIADKLAAGEDVDLDSFSFPLCLSLKGASMKTAGKTLFSHFATVDRFNGVAPADKKLAYHCRYFKATTVLESKDNNKFFVISLEPGEMCSKKELAVLAKWDNAMHASTVNIVEEDDNVPAF